jgi:hypothetical protein
MVNTCPFLSPVSADNGHEMRIFVYCGPHSKNGFADYKHMVYGMRP